MAKKTKDIVVETPTKSKTEVVSQLPAELEISKESIDEIKVECRRIGMSLSDYLEAIQRGLVAKKITIDKYGEEHEEDDTTSQLKAALLGLEVEGYIKNKTVQNDNRKFTQVNYTWNGE